MHGGRLLLFKLNGKHKLLVKSDWHVDHALLELRFSCRLHRSEARFAVLLGVCEEGIHERVEAVLQLDYLAIAATSVKSSLLREADILQLVAHDENCAPGHILKVHLEGLENILHRIEWVLRIDHLCHVEVDLIKFLDIELLDAGTKCTQ